MSFLDVLHQTLRRIEIVIMTDGDRLTWTRLAFVNLPTGGPLTGVSSMDLLPRVLTADVGAKFVEVVRLGRAIAPLAIEARLQID